MASRLLVVEDDSEFQRLVRSALTRAGYEVVAASDAREGLAALAQSGRIDLALLDVNMPGMDGLEMLRRLRAGHSDLPVIMMTADQTPTTVVEAMREQACDFLSKPFELDELLSAVESALKLRPHEVAIEVLSARPEWVELRVPCDSSAVEPLERLMSGLQADMSNETRQSVTYAFREMLQNAIEYGGKNDPSRSVEVGYLRTPRVVIYRIKDPGEGFSLESLYTGDGATAAFLNPEDDPTAHERARASTGMRPGGFGIMIARELVDEMVYNERHNEVMLIKYLTA